MDGAEDIEIGRRSNIALVRRKAEHGDRQLLLIARFDSQRRPADGTLSDRVHTILKRVSLTGGVVTAGEHDRFNRSIQFRNRDLQGHLHGVKT